MMKTGQVRGIRAPEPYSAAVRANNGPQINKKVIDPPLLFC